MIALTTQATIKLQSRSLTLPARIQEPPISRAIGTTVARGGAPRERAIEPLAGARGSVPILRFRERQNGLVKHLMFFQSIRTKLF